MQDRSLDDFQIETSLGHLLRAGVLLAGAVVAIGGIVYLVRHGLRMPEYGIFHGELAELRMLGGIVSDAIRLRGRAIIQLGLVLLIATPIARVAFSLFAFARERDYQYVLLTLVVLGLLIYSLLGSAG